MLTRTLLLAAVVSAAVTAGAPSPTRADEQLCVLLLPDDAVELLVNRCGACREVTLQRVRDGGGIPSVRSLMLPGDAAFQTPFRGPGRTRIVGERNCPPPPGRDISEAAMRR